MADNWQSLGQAAQLAEKPLHSFAIEGTRLAVVFKDGLFSVLSGICNHAGGPLGEGRLDGDFVTCPWHYWKFHCRTGKGEPGYEEDKVPVFQCKIEDGRLWVDLNSADARTRKVHAPHPLARTPQRQPGPVRVAAISTTTMTAGQPRFSTSDFLLDIAVAHALESECETRTIRLRDLNFRHCEGFYSKSARACTWPCSITQMDPADQLDQVYEAMVHWADVMVISTPIRWDSASSLYYKMVERMNCIQNQETVSNRELLKNKVVGFIITGGQDNVQAVAGQMLGFFAEVGRIFPQFPYIAHSRGWSAEDMENNVKSVQKIRLLRQGAEALIDRCAEMARIVLGGSVPVHTHVRGGRKAHPLAVLPDE